MIKRAYISWLQNTVDPLIQSKQINRYNTVLLLSNHPAVYLARVWASPLNRNAPFPDRATNIIILLAVKALLASAELLRRFPIRAETPEFGGPLPTALVDEFVGALLEWDAARVDIFGAKRQVFSATNVLALFPGDFGASTGLRAANVDEVLFAARSHGFEIRRSLSWSSGCAGQDGEESCDDWEGDGGGLHFEFLVCWKIWRTN